MEVKDMEKIVQDHENRITELEKNYSEVKREIAVVQASQSKIENMIYRQNTEQRELIDHHQKEQNKMFSTLLTHTLGIKKENHKQKWQLIGALFGGGGVVVLIVELVQKWIGG